MISKDSLNNKLEKLELLINKTQPDESDKEQLFQQHQIDNLENIRYVNALDINISNEEREHLIYIMRTSNRVWKMRNKMLEGDWNLEDIKLDEMEQELRNLLPNNKIAAIKHYRNIMNEELGKQVSLRDAKDRIDNLSREMTYEQGLIINK
jgi:ribosomal protein L7/L12